MSKVKFGISNLHFAARKEAADGAFTYETPIKIPGTVNISIEREAEQNIFYADNIPYFTSTSKQSQTLELEVADIAREAALQYLGYLKSKTGSILETNNPVNPSFAMLFQIETDVRARKIAYYNCTAVETDEEYNTNEESIEPTTSQLSVTSVGETVGDTLVFREICEPGDSNYSTFFTTVNVPELAESSGD